MNSQRAQSHAWKRIHGDEKPTSTPMKAIPLYDLTWREYAKGESGTYGVTRSQTHEVAVEREPAMSLFNALEEASGFYDVAITKSATSRWVTDHSSDAAAQREP